MSSLPNTIGTIWHDIFDDISTAYHKKVAKDKANSEGLVVNPPDLGNLPGEEEVTYASQVKDILIPYTTREDTFHYYEERNYVNDINREHTEVLQTYDRELKGRETYSYGHGRVSYLNNETGKHYHYLTNQAGSVTSLIKDGSPVASGSYTLYGATKASTDTTGNPFAYNGEARDVTGLDYLRARYYDSSAGTFLTEDSYQGEMTDPLSQNLYSYVHNNPVNYTDPSGHRAVKLDGTPVIKRQAPAPTPSPSVDTQQQRRYSQMIVGEDALGRAISLKEHTERRIKTEAGFVAPESYRQAFGAGVTPTSNADYVRQQEAQRQAQVQAQREQAIRDEYAQATGIKGTPKSREGQNLSRNWGEALAKTLKHVCNPQTTRGQDSGTKNINFVSLREIQEISKLSLKELEKAYGSLISQQRTYLGTGYFNPNASAKNRLILSRYQELKAIEEAKTAQKMAELNKYHYTNLYKHIEQTGLRPDGTPASDAEKAIAPYIPLIEPIQNIAEAVAWHQVGKYNAYLAGKSSSLPVKPNKPNYSNNLSSLADDISNKIGGEVTQLKNGYKVEIPNGKKPITVRLMDSGSGGRDKPYFRVSIDGKGSLDLDGNLSADRGLTHINLSDSSLEQIQSIIVNYKGGE